MISRTILGLLAAYGLCLTAAIVAGLRAAKAVLGDVR